MTTMETIAMVMAGIGDDAAFGRVVRALVEAHINDARKQSEHAAADALPDRAPVLALVPTASGVGRSHGKTFDDAFGKSLAAAVRASGGKVEWTSRYIKETVPGYRGATARSIGNALGQWSRAWKASGTTFYGLRVTGVHFGQRVDDRACAVYVIESVAAAKAS